jgi:hypothetical protein
VTRIQIPVAILEFVEGGNTIWVHSPDGATVLRIKTKGRITVDRECSNTVSHADIVVDAPIHICLVS